jgi:hypothetical protein
VSGEIYDVWYECKVGYEDIVYWDGIYMKECFIYDTGIINCREIVRFDEMLYIVYLGT